MDRVKIEVQPVEGDISSLKHSNLTLYLGFLPVLFLFALVLGLWLFPPPVTVYEPHFLLPLFNSTLFLAACVISFIAWQSYLLSGSATILWLGCGVLALGTGALAAGWLIYPFGPNANVTIFNMAVLFAAICHTGGLLSGLDDRAGRIYPGGSPRRVTLVYLAIFAAIALLVGLTICGLMPPFFIQGQGPTVLRQYVVEWSIVLLTFASLVIMVRFRRHRASFLFWYSLALALVVTAMLAFFLQVAVGSLIGWVGRSSYLLAAIYFLISVNSARRQAKFSGVGLSEAMADLFGPEQHRALFDNLNESLIIDELLFDGQGQPCDWRILNVNPTYLKSTGKSREEVVGRRVTEIFGLDRAPEPFLSHFARVVQTGEPARVEAFFEPLQMHMQVSAFHLGGPRFATLVTDVTERKRAEEAVRQSQKTFSELIERTPFGIYVVDSQFCIAMMNRGSQEGAFRNVRHVIGRDFADAMRILWPEPVAAEIIGRFRHTLETGKPYFSPKFVNPRADADIVESYEWELHRMTLPDGRHGVICYYFDSTNLREAERSLKERTAELEFANRELEAFTYSVSHDLKAPIRAIQGFSEMLENNQKDRLDEDGLRLLSLIIGNTSKMNQLIEDLLALSRLGRQQVRKSAVDLTALTKQIFEHLQQQTPERIIKLTIAELPPAWGDPSLLDQVMENLLGNAIKYTKTKTTAAIEVGGRSEGPENIFYVKDDGIGFDPRYAGKLFGVFQRLHGSQQYEGTGVGLSIVKRIVERHGGRVWAEAKVNEGATFYFALPVNGK